MIDKITLIFIYLNSNFTKNLKKKNHEKLIKKLNKLEIKFIAIDDLITFHKFVNNELDFEIRKFLISNLNKNLENLIKGKLKTFKNDLEFNLLLNKFTTDMLNQCRDLFYDKLFQFINGKLNNLNFYNFFNNALYAKIIKFFNSLEFVMKSNLSEIIIKNFKFYFADFCEVSNFSEISSLIQEFCLASFPGKFSSFLFSVFFSKLFCLANSHMKSLEFDFGSADTFEFFTDFSSIIDKTVSDNILSAFVGIVGDKVDLKSEKDEVIKTASLLTNEMIPLVSTFICNNLFLNLFVKFSSSFNEDCSKISLFNSLFGRKFFKCIDNLYADLMLRVKKRIDFHGKKFVENDSKRVAFSSFCLKLEDSLLKDILNGVTLVVVKPFLTRFVEFSHNESFKASFVSFISNDFTEKLTDTDFSKTKNQDDQRIKINNNNLTIVNNYSIVLNCSLGQSISPFTQASHLLLPPAPADRLNYTVTNFEISPDLFSQFSQLFSQSSLVSSQTASQSDSPSETSPSKTVYRSQSPTLSETQRSVDLFSQFSDIESESCSQNSKEASQLDSSFRSDSLVSQEPPSQNNDVSTPSSEEPIMTESTKCCLSEVMSPQLALPEETTLLPLQRGRIFEFNFERGFGSISKTDVNKIYFHIIDVCASSLLAIRPGIEVEFETILHPKGLRAKKVTIVNDPKTTTSFDYLLAQMDRSSLKKRFIHHLTEKAFGLGFHSLETIKSLCSADFLSYLGTSDLTESEKNQLGKMIDSVSNLIHKSDKISSLRQNIVTGEQLSNLFSSSSVVQTNQCDSQEDNLESETTRILRSGNTRLDNVSLTLDAIHQPDTMVDDSCIGYIKSFNPLTGFGIIKRSDFKKVHFSIEDVPFDLLFTLCSDRKLLFKTISRKKKFFAVELSESKGHAPPTIPPNNNDKLLWLSYDQFKTAVTKHLNCKASNLVAPSLATVLECCSLELLPIFCGQPLDILQQEQFDKLLLSYSETVLSYLSNKADLTIKQPSDKNESIESTK